MRRKRRRSWIGVILFIVFLPIAVLWELLKIPSVGGRRRSRYR